MRLLPFVLLIAIGCGEESPPAEGKFIPPVTIGSEEPIPYPPELFQKGVEGEVMLYVVVDTAGAVVPDSTRIETASGYPEFDAAALEAAGQLRFVPARRGDTAVMSPVQVPIRFTRPDSVSNGDEL